MNETATPAPRRVGLSLALLAGLLLRLWGLSHDLHTGREYHPDIPKQVRAVERYLDGKYYQHTGLSDYDGYPLFHAHLVEYLARGYVATAQGVCDLMGLEARIGNPSLRTIYWLMRLLNVVLSTLAILLVFRIVVPLAGRLPALFGAWLMALSPADISGAHYGAGDPAAAFFALWAVERALAVWREGRALDYLLAAAAAVCAFGAKYHAGMCLLPVGLAHLLRQPTARALFGAASLRRILLLVATCTAALFLVIPTMMGHPGEVLEEIAGFLGHVTSGDRLATQIEDDSLQARFLFSMQRNGPTLVDILSWPVIAACLAALGFGLRRDRAVLILLSLPLVYFLLGVSLRPLAHPVYHVLMTGPVYAIAAVLGARLWHSGLPLARIATLALGMWSLASVGRLAAREGFLFQHQDTRRVAQAWMAENVPLSLAVEAGPYTFQAPSAESDGAPSGLVHISSSIRPLSTESVQLASFALEKRPLPFFRNPTLRIGLAGVADWSPACRMPLFLPVPSQTGSDWVFDSTPVFLRDGKMLYLPPGQAVDRLFVRAEMLSNVLAVVRSGPTPVFVRLSFGGVAQHVSMGPGEARALSFPHPTVACPRLETGLVYRSRAESSPGPATVTWAFMDAERGVALFNAGLREEAREPLLRASDADPAQPTLALLARLAALSPGTQALSPVLDERAAPFATDWSADRVRAAYGIATAYLDALPYLAWGMNELVTVGLRADDEAAVGDDPVARYKSVADHWRLATPRFSLAPGVYQLGIRYASPQDATQLVSVAVHGFSGPLVLTTTLPPASARIQRADVPLALPHGITAGRVEVVGSGAGWKIEQIELRPDIVGTLDGYGVAWRGATGTARAGDEQHPFAATGPRTEQIPALRAMNAPFARNLELTGFRLRDYAASRGGDLGLNLYWGVVGPAPRAADLGVWIHVIDEKGKTRFQGDHRLVDRWHTPRDPGDEPISFMPIPVPGDAEPGAYRIVVGLFDAKTQRRVKVAKTCSAAQDGGALLPVTISIR